ncbi:MAG: hypothetical protein LIO85_10140 [Rikenellaceae bacterium]|nr:hypothetical protein [Rikenellaceae bacterium]
MKKLSILAATVCMVCLVSCGGEHEEQKIRFGTEWDELKGNPRTMLETSMDYDGVPPGQPGDTVFVTATYYLPDGKMTTREYFDYFDEDEDYTIVYEYDDNGRMVRSVYTDHHDDEGSFWTIYNWKGGMISRVENHDEDGMFSYYKYSYKGNREVSSGFYSAVGVKIQQVDTEWDGERVVKQTQKSDGSEIVRTIEYPDVRTEFITINGFGPEDGGLSLEMTVTYDEDGKFTSFTRRSEDAELALRYSYEYDQTGNWTKRTVTYGDGDEPYRVDTRVITYY